MKEKQYPDCIEFSDIEGGISFRQKDERLNGESKYLVAAAIGACLICLPTAIYAYYQKNFELLLGATLAIGVFQIIFGCRLCLLLLFETVVNATAKSLEIEIKALLKKPNLIKIKKSNIKKITTFKKKSNIESKKAPETKYGIWATLKNDEKQIVFYPFTTKEYASKIAAELKKATGIADRSFSDRHN